MSKARIRGVGTKAGAGQRAIATATAFLCLGAILAGSARAAAPELADVEVTGVTPTSATFKATIDPKAKVTRWHFEYGLEDCSDNPCSRLPGSEGKVEGSSPVPVSISTEGLSERTLYHYRLVAKNGDGEVNGQDKVFATQGPPFKGLPDTRAYEQASPIDKNGGDVLGDLSLLKANASGSGITFSSTVGVPGGQGAQEFPTYLSSRASAWSTKGLLPPPSQGERAQIIGWTPDFTETFTAVALLGQTMQVALITENTATHVIEQIAPYTTKAAYAYVGQSQDGSVVLFESRSALPVAEGAEPKNGFPNLYAWDRGTGDLRLAGQLNDETAPPKGAFGGPYEWTEGISPQTLRIGGAVRGFYLQDEHAVTPQGNIYFTEAGTGQLYLRVNPAAPQSEVNGQGKCLESARACTIHVSASRKTDGQGEGGADTAGPQPAAFQAASADGSEVFFTSHEKLTNNANTGPEQPKATIGIGSSASGAIEDAGFIPKRAVGVAVDSKFVYWADPIGGTIGRAEIGGGNPDPEFIVPGPIECEGGENVESKPRYVAVDSKHIYWTNPGCSDSFGPLDEKGMIGRADIEGTEASIEPEIITGASNPQGIGVNSEHIYWTNAARDPNKRSIGRAEISGDEVKKVEQLFSQFGSPLPNGLAVSADYIYYTLHEIGDKGDYVSRIPLDGGKEEFIFLGFGVDVRDVTVDAAAVYWVTQAEGAIGRISLSDFKSGTCAILVGCDKEFIKPGGALNGLASDATHLYWSVNGESTTNPGNDLYRFEVANGVLEDLTPDSTDTNGAEVQGVLAASGDGRYIYFAANGDLDGSGPASIGNCEGAVSSMTGSCNLYLWHGGESSFVARLKGNTAESADSLNWAATPRGQFGTSSYVPKTSFISADGQSLLFRSQEALTAYDNEGAPEFYRFQTDAGISCATCSPTGEGVAEGPRLGRIVFPGLGPLASVAAVSSRNFSSSGDEFFFETTEALVPEDTNGQGGCPSAGGFLSCLDVYEWEAAGASGCNEDSAAYSPLNNGCIFLISTGKSAFPSLFADASASGDDVFFFARQSLVGQDKDELQDVYDARVGGGLGAQNPVSVIPCESSDACHGQVPPPPVEPSAGSATFVGPGDPVPRHRKPKAKKPKKHKAKKKHRGKGKKRSRN